MKKLLPIVQYFYCEFSLSAGSFPSIPLVSRQYNFNDFLPIKIPEISKRSSYQSVINSVSCIKPFDNFDFVCRVLLSHVFLFLVVEQGPPFSVTFCDVIIQTSKVWLPLCLGTF